MDWIQLDQVEFRGGSKPSVSIRMANSVTSAITVNLSRKILHHGACQMAQICGNIWFEF